MTDNAQPFLLERLYATTKEQPDSPYQLAARSAGASPAQITEFRRLANLLPPVPGQRTDAMPGSLGLFRAESADYVLVKARQGEGGLLQFQYLMFPAQALRRLGGNIRVFEAWAREPIPTFEGVREDLTPFQFGGLEPADAEAQTEDIFALLKTCKNNFKTVGGLLAGVVQAMGLAIINAPPSLAERLTFIQGLLTLLPRPVRAGITWASSVIDPARTNSQIKIMAWDARPARHLVFDWATGKLLTDAPTDTYANYMLSQLRLDTSLVLEQTAYLERTAIWRTMRKDDLSNALGWASRRASLDSAIMSGQAADPKMVAGVLREDPTLSDEMRIAYAKHMLALTLTLDEAERSDVLAPVAAKFRAVSDALFETLKEEASKPNRALAVYHLLTRWITQATDTFEPARWRPLLGLAALTRSQPVYAEGKPEKIAAFLDGFLDESPTLGLDSAIAQMIGAARKFGYQHESVTQSLFLLAVMHLPAGGLQRLLSDSALVAKLPEALRTAVANLEPNAPQPAPGGLLARASAAYGPERRSLILARLAEWALLIQRADLLDPDVLNGLIAVGLSPAGERFDLLFEHIVNDLSQLSMLRTLDQKALRSLVGISLVRGRMDMAITQLEFYQNELYTGAPPEMMGALAQTLFRETPLAPAQVEATFDAMSTSQLRASTRAQAHLGALLANNWSPDVSSIANRLTAMISNDASLVSAVGYDYVIALLKMTTERHDVVETLRLSSALVENALLLGVRGPDVVERIFSMINWGPEMTSSSLEVLRSYVRRAPMNYAVALTGRAGTQYGAETGQALTATYTLRLLLGAGGSLNTFTEQVGVAAALLQDMAATYHESQEAPSVLALRRTVESMSGGLTDAERDRLAQNLYRIGAQIVIFARRRNRVTARGTGPLADQSAPASGVDALRWIGTHFADSRAFPLVLQRADAPHLVGSRSVNMLLRESDLIAGLFYNMNAAFPENAPTLDNKAFRSEVDSLWGSLSLYVQRQIQEPLARSSQLLGEVIGYVGDRASDRSLANGGFGAQLQRGRAQPRNVIDSLRWISGYFARQHY